jgi:NhaP-type Na+/H+ or K+/H+ antiporter
MNEKLPGEDTIMLTAVCTIILSVVGHGLSAHPLVSKLFAGKAGSVGQ